MRAQYQAKIQIDLEFTFALATLIMNRIMPLRQVPPSYATGCIVYRSAVLPYGNKQTLVSMLHCLYTILLYNYNYDIGYV